MYIASPLFEPINLKTTSNSILFNKPYITGREIIYLSKVMRTGKMSGDGVFTQECEKLFAKKYGFTNNLLVTSCTHALEMAALLLEIKEGDEVIMPSYTFVSTANAFMLRGAKIVFADSRSDHPGIDEEQIEALVTEKTKAIVVVHYAGVACDMDKIIAVAKKYNLAIVSDTAHGVESFYKGKSLGTLADISAFSFHDTKNISCGEGGLINIPNEAYLEKAEIIREKGTNRSNFLRGEVDRYGWVGIGSSYVMSELNAAYLLAQLEHVEDIQQIRLKLWEQYYQELQGLQNHIQLPVIPDYASNNAHLFYLVLNSQEQRNELIDYLKTQGIQSVFHYASLHNSKFYKPLHDRRTLVNSDRYTDCLLRLPLYCDLTNQQVRKITDAVKSFFAEKY